MFICPDSGQLYTRSGCALMWALATSRGGEAGLTEGRAETAILAALSKSSEGVGMI